MKKIFSIFVVMASFVIFAQASSDKHALTTIDGKSIHVTGGEDGLVFEEYKGKIVFLEFFGHKCPPCLMMIDRYVKLKEKYKDKIAIVAIEVQGLDNQDLKAFVKERGINYTAVSQEKADHFVQYVSVRSQWQGSIPYLLILDKKGNVQLIHSGPLPQTALEEAVNQLSK